MVELFRAACVCALTVPPSLQFVSTRRRPAAFTLLELMLALGIIALVGVVFIGGSAQMLNDRPVSADDVFWKAVQEARKQALKSGNEFRITFVDERDKGKRFVVSDGTAPRDFPLPATVGPDFTVTFLTTQKGASAVLIAGQMVETQTVPAVIFYGDGTCTAFRAQFQRGGNTHLIAIDPWTCAPVLTPPDPNAPLAP
jgi:general secretion pathway protein H